MAREKPKQTNFTKAWLSSPKPEVPDRTHPDLKFTCWCGWSGPEPLGSSHNHLKEDE